MIIYIDLGFYLLDICIFSYEKHTSRKEEEHKINGDFC